MSVRPVCPSVRPPVLYGICNVIGVYIIHYHIATYAQVLLKYYLMGENGIIKIGGMKNGTLTYSALHFHPCEQEECFKAILLAI